jgi:uncharacterized RDD family membrane protein YckC
MSRSRTPSTDRAATHYSLPPAGIARRSLAWFADAVLASMIIFAGVTAVDLLIGPAVRFQPEATHLVNVIQVNRYVVAVAAIVAAALGAGYFAMSWVLAGGSPFQLLLGMRVLDADGAGKLTTGRALLRWVILFPPFATVSALTFDFPGAGMLIWGSALLWYPALLITTGLSQRKQGLHDVLSRAIVVRIDPRAAREFADVH